MYLNEFQAYNSVPLSDIVDGAMSHSLQCYPYAEGMQPGQLHSVVNMKVIIGEIWDFYLEFFDWKTTSLKNVEQVEDVDPWLEITLDSAKASVP